MCCKLYLITCIASSLLALTAASFVESLKGQIFSETGISPSETLSLLKQLNATITSGNTSQDDDKVLDQTRWFIDADNVTKEKCSETYFASLINYQKYGNVRRYLEECRDRQFILCKPQFAERLQSFVATLDAKDKREMELLWTKVAGAQLELEEAEKEHSPNVKIAQNHLYKGILDYIALESDLPEPTGREIDEIHSCREEFVTLFNWTMNLLCHKVTNYLRKGVEIYGMIENSLELMDAGADKSTLSWIHMINVCEEILGPKSPDTIVDGTFELLSKRFFKQ